MPEPVGPSGKNPNPFSQVFTKIGKLGPYVVRHLKNASGKIDKLVHRIFSSSKPSENVAAKKPDVTGHIEGSCKLIEDDIKNKIIDLKKVYIINAGAEEFGQVKQELENINSEKVKDLIHCIENFDEINSELNKPEKNIPLINRLITNALPEEKFDMHAERIKALETQIQGLKGMKDPSLDTKIQNLENKLEQIKNPRDWDEIERLIAQQYGRDQKKW